jgi:hypothetical protein
VEASQRTEFLTLRVLLLIGDGAPLARHIPSLVRGRGFMQSAWGPPIVSTVSDGVLARRRRAACVPEAPPLRRGKV